MHGQADRSSGVLARGGARAVPAGLLVLVLACSSPAPPRGGPGGDAARPTAGDGLAVALVDAVGAVGAGPEAPAPDAADAPAADAPAADAPAAAAAAAAPPEAPDPKPARGVTQDKAAGGTHWRFKGRGGNVHVWRPGGFRRDTAGIIVYLHGYRSSADQTWKDYRMAQQFRACRQNALYVVPDAARGMDDGVHFPSLSDLLREVFRATRLPRPPGPIVVIGHSGGFRTIVPWLDHTGIAHVILLDALYGASDRFEWWLEDSRGAAGKKLTIVGQDTADEAAAFLRRFKSVERMKQIPDRWSQFTRRQRTARILYIRSQYGHMQLVTGGKAIPLLLRRTPLRPI